MNKNQKQVLQSQLSDEQKVVEKLKGIYAEARAGVDDKLQALLARADVNTPTVIYQIKQQQALKAQIDGILNQLHGQSFATIEEYLEVCYSKGYAGAMYDISGQVGAPIVMAPDPKQVVKAIKLDSKISTNLYTSLGQDVGKLKQNIAATISRGVSTGMSYKEISDQLQQHHNIGYNNAIRIVRTEGHRIQTQSGLDACKAAADMGCDVVKQWDSTLDGRTRPTHRQLDGQIREINEPFEVTNAKGQALKADAPGHFGRPGEDCNCRCALLQRAKWALDDEELEVLKKRAEFFGLDKTKDFDEFSAKYLSAVQPAPVKPKKEILTKKKLEEKIADGQKQLADLEAQLKAHTGGLTYDEYVKKHGTLDAKFKTISGGLSYDDIIKQYGSLDGYVKGMPLKKLQALHDMQGLHDQMGALTADLNTWDDLLDKKLVQAELKKLKKSQVLAQDALDQMDTSKEYINIWKDPVTVKDYGDKQGAIAAKKKYFEGKLIKASDAAEMQKWKDLIDDLDDFEVKGSAYYKAQQDLDKATRDWEKLKKSGTLKVDTSAAGAYTQDRKDAALWFDRAHGGFSAADKYFDPPSKTLHKAATPKERDGFYTYTAGSGGHNRPLAGFEKPWSKPGSGWEQQFYKGPKKVWIDFEGKGEQIRGLTTLIEKSTYPDDVWLQSGQGFASLEGFLGIPYGTAEHMSDAALQQYVGRRNVIYNFISTAVNEGGGSMFNAKPMKFNIYAPKGSQMLYASDVGAFGKGENEMILQRGGTYEITKIYWGKDATDGNRRKLFVDMEIHPEAGYDTFQQDPNEWTGSRENYHTK